MKRLSDSSVTSTQKDSCEFSKSLKKNLQLYILSKQSLICFGKGTQTELQIFNIEQASSSIKTSSPDIPELFTIDTMTHLEEIYVADA